MNSGKIQVTHKDDTALETLQLPRKNSQSAETAIVKTQTKQPRLNDPREYELRIIRNNMRRHIVVSNDPIENERIKFIRAANRVARLNYGNSYTKKILRMRNVDDRSKIWALFFVFDKFQMRKSQATLSKALQAVAVRQSLSKTTKLLSRNGTQSSSLKQISETGALY